MDSELAKAVEAGKLTQRQADALRRLPPGGYCAHKSWGFGQVDSVNFLLGQIHIHFAGKRDHAMQLAYAADSLQPIPADHILARKASDLDGLRALARTSPLEVVRCALASLGGAASADAIARTLVPEVFSEAEFKRWWSGAKRAMKADGHFVVPGRKGDPVTLRDAPVEAADDLLAAFDSARQLKQRIAAMDALVKGAAAFAGAPERLEPVVRTATEEARRNQRLHGGEALQLLLARDELCRAAGVPPPEGTVTLGQMLREEQRQLVETIDSLPAGRQGRVLAALPEAFGEGWVERALDLMTRSKTARAVSETARLLQAHGRHDDLRRGLQRWIREHTITAEMLLWLCKERTGDFADLITPALFPALLDALDRDRFVAGRRSNKLHDLLVGDADLIGDLLRDAEPDEARDCLRRLIASAAIEEINKRSLMARLLKVHPELQPLISDDPAEQQQALVVSWASLEKRKAEYEDLVNRQIPANVRDIAIAREYGDLRENFEFKSAKETQRVLARRRFEMERDLARARGTNFEGVDVSQVAIGTVVTVRDDAGREEAYTILGAWDSDPERHVVSYLASIGQALLGKRMGDAAELPDEAGARTVRVVSIAPYRTS